MQRQPLLGTSIAATECNGRTRYRVTKDQTNMTALEAYTCTLFALFGLSIRPTGVLIVLTRANLLSLRWCLSRQVPVKWRVHIQ